MIRLSEPSVKTVRAEIARLEGRISYAELDHSKWSDEHVASQLDMCVKSYERILILRALLEAIP
jgi:hypothetical protein